MQSQLKHIPLVFLKGSRFQKIWTKRLLKQLLPWVHWTSTGPAIPPSLGNQQHGGPHQGGVQEGPELLRHWGCREGGWGQLHNLCQQPCRRGQGYAVCQDRRWAKIFQKNSGKGGFCRIFLFYLFFPLYSFQTFLILLRTSNASQWARTQPPSHGRPPNLMAARHWKARQHLYSHEERCARTLPPAAADDLSLLRQVISWRGRRKAPAGGPSSTLMSTSRRRTRPRGWSRASCMRWGSLPSTASACLSPASTPSPSCPLVRSATTSAASSLLEASVLHMSFCRPQLRLASRRVCRCTMWRTAPAPWSGLLQRRSEPEAWMATSLNTAKKEVVQSNIMLLCFDALAAWLRNCFFCNVTCFQFRHWVGGGKPGSLWAAGLRGARPPRGWED